MKTIGIREARENLRGVLDMAQNEEVVILVHGRPLARIVGAGGESLGEIAERVALEKGRARMADPSPKPVSLADVRARLEQKWAEEKAPRPVKTARKPAKRKPARRKAGRA